MDTFNLGLVFGEAEYVFIIVCASEKPIDRLAANMVATKYFKQAIQKTQFPSDIIHDVVDGIKKECGCNVVSVTADACCLIPRAVE